MAITLDDNARAFLEGVHFGTLATVSSQGIPHQVLVWYVLQGDEILVATQSTAYKVTTVRSNPWASLSIADGPRYLTVRGRATIDDDQERGAAIYRQIAVRYLGEAGADQWMTQSPGGAANRVTIHIPIEHIVAPQR